MIGFTDLNRIFLFFVFKLFKLSYLPHFKGSVNIKFNLKMKNTITKYLFFAFIAVLFSECVMPNQFNVIAPGPWRAVLLLNGKNQTSTIYLPHRDQIRERSQGKILSSEDADLIVKLTDGLNFCCTQHKSLSPKKVNSNIFVDFFEDLPPLLICLQVFG